MKFNLPTRERCQEIVNNSEAFYCTQRNVYGCNVELYDYRLASFGDFVNNEAWELRGLCFIQDENGIWHRNILMNKFFNLNESKFDGTDYSWMLEDIKDKRITRVQEKLDGSVISFVKLPNGKIVAKSKMSFDSEQAKMAQEIFDNSWELRGMVESIMDDNKTAIFELISPFNQIVLPYNETELRLLQIRDNKTGEYASTSFMYSYLKLYDLEKMTATEYSIQEYTWDELLEKQLTEENIEGWIVTLDDGQMIKVKTVWYFQMHGLTTEGTRENLLIETILEDRIDDVISLIPDGEKKEFMINTIEKVQHKFNHLVVEYKKLRGLYYNKFNENRKEFALKYKDHELFGYVMKKLNVSFREVEQVAEQGVKDYILNKTRTLGGAKEFLARINGD